MASWKSAARKPVGSAVVACIGPVTAEAAVACGLPVTLVPDEYTLDGLVQALAQHFNPLFWRNENMSEAQIPVPIIRPRRLRTSPALRSMVRETHLAPTDFIYPLFVTHGEGVRHPIPSMPGVFQLSDRPAGARSA